MSDGFYIRHHAIIVTAESVHEIARAREEAERIIGRPSISEVQPTPAFGRHWTFFIGPDGGFEGYDVSADGDRARDEFIEWLNRQREPNGASLYQWAEVQYADENGDNRLLRTDSSEGPSMDKSEEIQ